MFFTCLIKHERSALAVRCYILLAKCLLFLYRQYEYDLTFLSEVTIYLRSHNKSQKVYTRKLQMMVQQFYFFSCVIIFLFRIKKVSVTDISQSLIKTSISLRTTITILSNKPPIAKLFHPSCLKNTTLKNAFSKQPKATSTTTTTLESVPPFQKG